MTEKNLEFWSQVSVTDPKYTKEINLGRKFHAIDPMYQIEQATKHMGVCGEGWGFEVVETVFLPIDSVALRIRLWKGSKEKYLEQWGQCKLYTDKNKSKEDHDCMKKATTDGLTKCLSLLGFNADVFMGKFDDNKYVQDLREKSNNQNVIAAKNMFDNLSKHMKSFTDKAEFSTWWQSDSIKESRLELKGLDMGRYNDLVVEMKEFAMGLK